MRFFKSYAAAAASGPVTAAKAGVSPYRVREKWEEDGGV